jgi:uncharacterized membrane protein YhhN
LWTWLYTSTGLQGNVFWFGLGLVFSLLGDMVLLSTSDRMFIFGLIAFLLTHIFYIIGFHDELLNPTGWSVILIFFIFINSLRLLQRIVGAMQTANQNALITPVVIYGSVISLMLYTAISTIFDPAWRTSAALLVSIGAFFFWMSDLILAWNKFVSPIRNGRILNMLSYHVGQIGLIAGVISQFYPLRK